jgi:putative transposase
MARFARLVVPGYPHHVTQRGVRSMAIFADDHDRQTYLQYMAEEAERCGVTFLGWCMMANHVHLIAVPEQEDSLARGIGNAHRRYTRRKNFGAEVRGYLFQGRFHSCVLDETHLLAAGRYVERNPVKAGMVKRPQDYPWSSCRYHCFLVNKDPLVRERRLPELTGDWESFLKMFDEETDQCLCRQTRTGRPLGDDRFVLKVESLTQRSVRCCPPGRPRTLK